MNINKALTGCLLIFFVFFFSTNAFSAQKSSEKKADKDILVLNNISINKIKKEIRVNVKIALERGILEYLLTGEHGKTHETVFKMADNMPSELNFGLLLIGCEPMNYDAFIKLSQKGVAGFKELLKEHDKSVLDIKFEKNGKAFPASFFMRDRADSKLDLTWVFTGGYFLKGGRYTADMELSYIGIWPDLNALINLFSAQGNPYRGDFGFEINENNKKLKIDQDYVLVIKKR